MNRPRAGRPMVDTRTTPTLVLLVVALLTFVSSLAAFGSGHHDVGLVLVGVAVVASGLALVWRSIENRRASGSEKRWYAEHPDVDRQRPSADPEVGGSPAETGRDDGR